jgi:hypothetical protein
MDIQRLRNLTTGKLHTRMGDIYQDIEFIVGEKGIMTHHLPVALKAMMPWLEQNLPNRRLWDGKFDTSHTGDIDINPMTNEERNEFFERYEAIS